MEIKIQMLESYISKYDFEINRKILPKEHFSVNLNLGYKIQKPQNQDDGILVGLNLTNNIVLKDDKTNLGKINVNIYGNFSFKKGTNENEIQKLLKTEGVSMLYGQLKAYISANTALSQAIPTINLPVINFKIQED